MFGRSNHLSLVLKDIVFKNENFQAKKLNRKQIILI